MKAVKRLSYVFQHLLIGFGNILDPFSVNGHASESNRCKNLVSNYSLNPLTECTPGVSRLGPLQIEFYKYDLWFHCESVWFVRLQSTVDIPYGPEFLQFEVNISKLGFSQGMNNIIEI